MGLMAILDGRHALVTGGGRGIGRAIAKALSGAGATVTVLGRQEAALKDAVATRDASRYVLADVTNEAVVDAAVKQAVAARGPVDILIANAGTGVSVPFMKGTSAQFRDMFTDTAAFVSCGANMADAKRAMESVKGCYDVFITNSGDKQEPVLGWLTDVTIAASEPSDI